MLGGIIYGTKVYGDIVPDGMVREAYCDKCKDTAVLIEHEGQKKFYIDFIPLFKKGEKFHYLKCSNCNTIYPLDYHIYQKSKIQTPEERRAELFKGMSKEDIEEIDKVIKESGTFEVKCPSCSKPFRTENFTTKEKEIQCSNCNHVFTVRKKY